MTPIENLLLAKRYLADSEDAERNNNIQRAFERAEVAMICLVRWYAYLADKEEGE